jgi:hypothetical protein
MAKKIIAIKTRTDFDVEELFKKLKEFGFKFNATRDQEVDDIKAFEYYAAGPFHYLFLQQNAKEQ